MAYTVLARRYRSSTFDEVVGQAHIAQTLKKAITSGRIAHAFLFCGTRGTGKTSMARILAKALNCLSVDKATPTPCGTCSSCVGITSGQDMDYIEIDAASHTGVDNVREVIIGNSAYRPALCRYKIYLIDEVHMLSKSSFNALLKTLEEPPEHVKFILATTEAEKIPNTILSRCQRYDFKTIATKEVAAHLARICRDEGISAADDALTMIARAGGGSMRDSISLLDRLLSVGERTLTLQTIEAMLGLPKSEQLAELVDAITTAEPGRTLQVADGILSSGMSPDTLMAGLIDHLHNLLLIRVCGEKSDLVELVGVPMERVLAQAQRLDASILTQDIAVLEELRRQLRSGVGGRALMDATLVRLALAEQFRSVSELIAEGGTAPADEKKKPSDPVPPPVAPASLGATRESPARESAGEPVRPAVVVPVVVPKVAESPVVSAADEDDDLPRPGKVWDNSGPSLSELLAAKEGKSGVVGADAGVRNFQAVSEASLPQVWKGVLEGFRKSAPSLLGVLNDATLGSVQDGFAVVSLPSSHQHTARLIEKESNRQKIAASLSEALGAQVGVRVVVEAAAAEQRPAVVAAPEPRVNKPVLREVMARAAAEPARPLVVPDSAPAVGAAPVVKLTDALVEELRGDELIRGVMDVLGAKVVKVTEE